VPILGLIVFGTVGCTIERQTSPPRSANEELLISTAADRAAQQVKLRIPKGAKLYVDESEFEGTDSKYAIGALREQLLREGGRLVTARTQADYVIEIRSGALSIDEEQILLGIPQTNVPIPLTGTFALPEIAFFKKEERKGVAKFAAVGYDAKDGSFADASTPRYGFSHEIQWVVFLFISWKTSDVLPEAEREPIFELTAPEFPTFGE
jgi:hypothetical protein